MKINWDMKESTLNEVLKNIIYGKTLGLDDPKSFEVTSSPIIKFSAFSIRIKLKSS